MSTWAKRLAALSLLVTAGATLPASSAQAASGIICTSGSRIHVSDMVGYVIIASGCTYGGPGGITIPGGSYSCAYVHFAPEFGLLNGQRC